MSFHEFVQDEEGWKTHERNPLFVHQYLEVEQVRVSSPARPLPFEWTVCHRKAGVVVAAQTSEGGFVMIRQERVPLRATLWEFPAGQIDHATEHSPERIVAAGLKELEEESGYRLGENGRVRFMHHFLTSPGFTDEHCYQIWVQGAFASGEGLKLDPNECVLEVRVFAPEEIREMVADGTIRDANTLTCVARLAALGALWGRGE